MCLLYLIATSSSAASSPMALKSLGMYGASGKPGSRMNLEASSFDVASASQVRLKDAYLGGLRKEQQGNLTHEKEQISEETGDSESEPWYYKPVAQTNGTCGKTTCRRNRRIHLFSVSEKSETIKKRQYASVPYRHKQSLIRKPSTTWSG